ncbi:tmem106b [Scenedesmus sp. PABB004]|nr:tmem106b [Scenedesmus sp. PABB004]
MENYVQFSGGASPLPSRRTSFKHEAESGDGEGSSAPSTPAHAPPPPPPPPRGWVAGAAERLLAALRGPPPEPRFDSQYLTLIPLSDARLRPRRTRLIVSSLLLLAVSAVVGVFLAVPRGVSVGTIDVHSTRMTFNATTLTYRIILQADVPVFNPNYLSVSVAGNVSVSFFTAEAGWTDVGPVKLAPRSEPSVLELKVDASNLPRKYTAVVYTHCFNFPRRLIFFFAGDFTATYLGVTSSLPKIDTYFMLDCSGAKQLPGPATASNASAGGAAALALEAGGAPLAYRDWELDVRERVRTHGSGGGAVAAQRLWRQQRRQQR